MGRPPTKPKSLKDGWYLEVRNKGSKSGIKIRRDTEKDMKAAIEEVIVLGECVKTKFVNPSKVAKTKAK